MGILISFLGRGRVPDENTLRGFLRKFEMAAMGRNKLLEARHTHTNTTHTPKNSAVFIDVVGGSFSLFLSEWSACDGDVWLSFWKSCISSDPLHHPCNERLLLRLCERNIEKGQKCRCHVSRGVTHTHVSQSLIIIFHDKNILYIFLILSPPRKSFVAPIYHDDRHHRIHRLHHLQPTYHPPVRRIEPKGGVHGGTDRDHQWVYAVWGRVGRW